MNEKKNIDRLFQEKFKDFEVAPNDAIWNRINESLPNKKKKRRVLALWWQIGAVAAAIAILLTIGVSVFNSNKNNTQEFPVVDTDKIDTDNKQYNTSVEPSKKSNSIHSENERDNLKFVNSNTDQNTGLENQKNSSTEKDKSSQNLNNSNAYKQHSNTVVTQENKEGHQDSAEKSHNLIQNPTKTETDRIVANAKTIPSTSTEKETSQITGENEIKASVKNTIDDNTTAVAEQKSSETLKRSTLQSDKKNTTELKHTAIEDSEKPSIEDAIAENETTPIEKEEGKQNRWSVSPNVAPVYYNSLGQGSSLDQQFNENTKSSPVNISYGISGSYAVSKTLKIRAGINRVNLSQITSDVLAFAGEETAARGIGAQFDNISFNNGDHSVSLMSSNRLKRSSAPELFNSKTAGNLDQKFGFVEVPLELEYRLIDKTFGINVIGGFSTFFLSQNDIYADLDGVSTLIGEANNINDTSFSANFGLGMDYNLSKQWNINLEPTFKYQINTFTNTSGNFRPFFIGVYTGLSFKF